KNKIRVITIEIDLKNAKPSEKRDFLLWERDDMELICESNAFDPYLHESNEVDYSNPIVKEKVSELFKPSQTEIEKVKIAFEYVRDDISHSWDIQGTDRKSTRLNSSH